MKNEAIEKLAEAARDLVEADIVKSGEPVSVVVEGKLTDADNDAIAAKWGMGR
jgi:hypothetical protein